MQNNNSIYTELSEITEREFFQRELNVSVVLNCSYKMLEKESDMVIASTNPEFWTDFLRKKPKDSVVFILLGNETYEPQIFNALNGLESIRHVFIYNEPTKIFWTSLIKTVLGHVLDLGFQKLDYPDSVFRDFRNSMYLYQKFNSTSISYPHSFLPQGYSNNFAFKISQKFHLNSDYSLLSEDLVNCQKSVKSRSNLISFSGQNTNRRRAIVINAAKKYMNEPPDHTEGFRGSSRAGDSTYLDQLGDSKLILVPPGSFNNSNHRYTESLICGAIPVILAKNSLDPSENTNWTNQLPGLIPFSAKLLLRYLSRISDTELEVLLNKAREFDFSNINNFRNNFKRITLLS
jgi:hypothetical protein